jgi:phytanoyl-CoA hydroxylase
MGWHSPRDWCRVGVWRSSKGVQWSKRFNEDGFVSLPAFVVGNELRELQANVRRFICESVPQLPAEHVFCEEREDPTTLKQIQQLGEHDAWFAGFAASGSLREVAEHLLDGPVVPRNVQYFNKPPGIGKATPAHQDGHYFMLTPCDAVTMWLALDEADEQNGCVRYTRGSHRRGMREHGRTSTLGFSRGITDYPTSHDTTHEVACPASPGDLLVHHGMTIHRADANHAVGRQRRALGFIYYSERAQEDAVAHAAYQRDLAARLRAEGKIDT